MSLPHGGAHMDWPLSRDEKQYRIMQLYDRELKEVQHKEAAAQFQCDAETREGPFKARVSDASTADTEISAPLQAFCDDQLEPINEELEAAIHFGPLTDDINAAINSMSASTPDRRARSVAQHLRALTNAVATMLDGPATETPRQHSASATVQGSPTWRRAYSEDVSRSSGARRVSLTRRDGHRRTSRGSRSRDQSRSGLDDIDSDGTQGDTEEPRRKVDMGYARRRRWSRTQTQGVDLTRYSQGCKDGAEDSDDALEDHPSKSCSISRSRSLPPPKPLESLQDFLGELVPQCPF